MVVVLDFRGRARVHPSGMVQIMVYQQLDGLVAKMTKPFARHLSG